MVTEVVAIHGVPRVADYHLTAPATMWHDSDTATKIEFQKMITVSGIVFDIKNEKFGTDGLTLFYRLKDNQKGSKESSESNMVHPTRWVH